MMMPHAVLGLPEALDQHRVGILVVSLRPSNEAAVTADCQYRRTRPDHLRDDRGLIRLAAGGVE
jgi:hypothetical protein